MEKKDYIIIGMAIVILCIGIAFAVTNIDFGDDTKTQDFEAFTMEVKDDLTFNREVEGTTGMVTFRGNNSNGDFMKTTYFAKTGLIGLMAPSILDSVLRGNAPLDVNDKLTFNQPATSVAFYELEEDNITYYVAVIETPDLIIFVNNENLDVLIKMVNSIIIKDTITTNTDSSVSTPTTSTAPKNNNNSVKNDSVEDDWEYYVPHEYNDISTPERPEPAPEPEPVPMEEI